jgi:hypothetical protein
MSTKFRKLHCAPAFAPTVEREEALLGALCEVHRVWLAALRNGGDAELPPRLADEQQAFKERARDWDYAARAERLSLLQMQLEAKLGKRHSPMAGPLWPALPFAAEAAGGVLLRPRREARLEVVREGELWLVHDALAPEECRALIAASEARAFELSEAFAHLYMRRRSDRQEFIDAQLAALLYARAVPLIPLAGARETEGLAPASCNPFLRLCKYAAGQYFGPHFDGRNTLSDGRESRWTLMAYLNAPQGNFEGGATSFLDNETFEPWFVLQPRAGLVVVFRQGDEQGLLHEGDAVSRVLPGGDGFKYILRTDVVFAPAQPQPQPQPQPQSQPPPPPPPDRQ